MPGPSAPGSPVVLHPELLLPQSFEACPAGYTSQTNCLLPVSSTRFDVSPSGSLAYMVEEGSGEWASPRKWPISWVTAFCKSFATQLVEIPPGLQGGESTMVGVAEAAFISTSASSSSPEETM